MSVDGKWTVTIESPMGSMPTSLSVKSDGDTLIGTQSAQGLTSEITDGEIDGERISWVNVVTVPIKMKLHFAGFVTANEMSGKVKAGIMGTYSFTGVRVTS